MNGAEFNMVLLLATGIVALIGKYVYERVVTRIEERQAREAGQSGKQSADPSHRT